MFAYVASCSAVSSLFFESTYFSMHGAICFGIYKLLYLKFQMLPMFGWHYLILNILLRCEKFAKISNFSYRSLFDISSLGVVQLKEFRRFELSHVQKNSEVARNRQKNRWCQLSNACSRAGPLWGTSQRIPSAAVSAQPRNKAEH